MAMPEAGTLQATATRPAGIGPEGLSYRPANDRLWTLTDFAALRMLDGRAEAVIRAASKACGFAIAIAASFRHPARHGDA
jgi:hypothetical protein